MGSFSLYLSQCLAALGFAAYALGGLVGVLLRDGLLRCLVTASLVHTQILFLRYAPVPRVVNAAGAHQGYLSPTRS